MKRISFLALFLWGILAGLGLAQEPRVYKVPEFDVEWSKPSQYPDRIVLNLGEDPATSASVTWRTIPEIETAFAEIAEATGAPKFWRNAKTLKAITTNFDGSKVLTAGFISHYHSATFSNLLPDTVYAYRVGDGKRWSEWIQFRTASRSTTEPFSFLYVGDTQNFILELWSRLIREGYKKAPNASFIIHAGDLVNNAHREQEWQEWFDAGGWIHSSLPSFPVPGNHEYRPLNAEEEKKGTRSLSAQWNHQFTLPENGPEGLEETAYYMDYQDTRIIGLNTNVEHEKQATWLEEILSKTTQKWKVVTFHHPLFSASSNRDNTELRELLKPIFDKYHVDLVLQGHDHSYARGRVSPGENTLDGVNLRDRTGTVYVVSVSGGKMYGLRPNAWEGWEAERDRAAENTQLFQVITIEDNKLSFESYTAIGELYDAFDLIKNGKGPNTFVERKQEAIASRRFNNTIPYQDTLPDAIKNRLQKKYPGFEFDGVSYSKENGVFQYQVKMEKGNEEVKLLLDVDGDILKEVREND
ncbi:metallophosphoesterase [Ulvibacterium sp.]|uniref:metallophosphoesterase n=1 Tax=Ulvibacterium sp. TaxID=2665914 RepID=UPI0026207FB1|nr:metallophosphoesterase family protein [Ulvibacterium sp.]